jgi:hypothetical protein
LYWRIAIYKEPEGDKKVAMHEWIDGSIGKQKNGFGLLDNVDDHGAFSMYGAIGLKAMTYLVDAHDNLIRRRNKDGTVNLNWVSGDVLIAYCFAYTSPNLVNKPVELLNSIAKKYLKNLGLLTKDGDVSNRCNNFGVNYCPDSQAYKIGQPMAGPQFYTNSALFALAGQTSWFFKFVFWTHWIVLGGWYWCWFPVVYTKDKPLYYVRDMTMKALYVHKYVFGNRWWIRMPMEELCYKHSEYRNDLWYAMMGTPPINPIPETMDSFFSQKADCTSRTSDRLNGYLGKSLLQLSEQAKKLNYK